MKHFLAAILILPAFSLFGAAEKTSVSLAEYPVILEIRQTNFSVFLSEPDAMGYTVYCIPEKIQLEEMTEREILFCYDKKSSGFVLNIGKRNIVRSIAKRVFTVNGIVFSIVKKHFSLVRIICFSSIRKVL